MRYFLTIILFTTLTTQGQVFSGAETVPLITSTRVDVRWLKSSLFLNSPNQDGLTQSTYGVKSGLYSFHFKTRHYYVWGLDGNGNQVHPRQEFGNTSDSVMMGYNFKIGFTYTRPVGEPDINRPMAIAQAQTGIPFGSPPFGFEIQNGYLFIGTNVYDKTLASPNDRSQKTWRVMYLTPGVTQQFAGDIKFRRDPSGYMRFYVNGQPMTGIRVNPSTKVPLSGYNTGIVALTGNTQSRRADGSTSGKWYFKCGIYDWSIQSAPKDTTGYDAYLDDIRILDSTHSVTELFYTQPPAVNAGANQSITLPVNAVHLNATATAGTTPYTYAWLKIAGPTSYNIISPANYETDINNLTAGVYQFKLTVTDNAGRSTSDTVQVQVASAIVPVLNVSVTGTNANCYGSNTATATATVSGGAGTKTYLWTPGGQTTSSIGGKAAGTYTVTVTDSAGSTKQQSITLTQPEPITVTVSYGTITTIGGTTTVNVYATGGTGTLTGTGAFTGVGTGSHPYTVSDVNGCTGTTTINLVVTTSPMTLSLTPHNILCAGDQNGYVTSNLTGGTAPYNYRWQILSGLTPPDLDDSSASLLALTAGTYQLTVTDALNQTVSAVAVVSEPQAITATATAGTIATLGGTTTVTVAASGGTGSLTGTGTFTVTAGTYTYTITDSNSCSVQVSVTVAPGTGRPRGNRYKFKM